MPIVFIPTTDYSESAETAATITTLDVGYVKAGQAVAVSFRVGNTGATVQDLTFATDHPAVSLTVTDLTVGADGISDTVTATITASLDCLSTLETARLTAGSGDITESCG